MAAAAAAEAGCALREVSEVKDWREVQTWYLKMSKLALAIAIIRTKPENKSSKEYAEYLSRIILDRELSWKAKAERLEAEVLQLRQEFLLSKISLGYCPVNGDSSISSTTLSTHLNNGNSRNCSSQQEDDSGCDISNEDRIDSVSSLHSFEHPSQSFKLVVNTLPIMETNHDCKETSISTSTQFLQHIFRLRMLTKTGSLLTNFTVFESDFSTISDSIFGLLDGLITFCKNPNSLCSTIQTEAVCVLTDIITNSSLCDYLLKNHFRKLREFKKGLIQYVLLNCDINRFQVQHNISNCLVLLGRCSLLRKHLIDLLFSEINRFIDELLHACQNQSKYDITCYENMFFLCMVLEQLLQNETEETNASSSNLEKMKIFLQRLDQTILNLSDEFPLFSLYAWRIGTLFNSQMQINEQ
ncbi:meiosis-specific protein MEI4 [Rhinatrema bivittatum]|uniref:meiosis-specific protein MEI4 n=1 Tax=Rhinatrema bivittatum TaxID=194408 RepID=UPI0011275668|nr:meiosis-specific protein MEI4 [Rhinatrema bivittatum]